MRTISVNCFAFLQKVFSLVKSVKLSLLFFLITLFSFLLCNVVHGQFFHQYLKIKLNHPPPPTL